MTTTSGPERPDSRRPVALVTGVGRSVNLGAAIAAQLARDGWDIAFTYWTAYDERMPWPVEPEAAGTVTETLTAGGAATAAISADLSGPDAPARIFDAA